MTTIRLAVGEERAGIRICARPRWNSTGIRVEAGDRYAFEAPGTWSDGGIRCDADGFTTAQAPAISRWLLRPFERRRRVRQARWFQLSGALTERDDAAFPLGRRGEWTAPASGELRCFANDVSFAYWNNSGCVLLTVVRLA